MKSLFEQLSGTYCKQIYYLIPNLTLSTRKENNIGIYGQRHLYFLQYYRRVIYTNLLTNGNINKYLSKINRQAQER